MRAKEAVGELFRWNRKFRIQSGIITRFCLMCFLLLSSAPLYSQDSELETLLEMDLSDLKDVEILSASKYLQKISEVPSTVRVIESSTLREKGYFTLEEALQDLPGFQFRNIQGFNSYIFQRGIVSQNNTFLILIDGIQINELNSGGFYGGAQYNLENTERIEVIYGPASTLYGTNALSGIINLVTKDPNKHKGLDISAIVGTFNTINANCSYGMESDDGKFGLRLSAMYKDSEKAKLGAKQGDNNWGTEMENFEKDNAFDIKIRYSDLTLGSNFQQKQASRTTNYKSTGTSYSDKGSLWNIWFLNTYLSHNKSFSDKLALQTKLYYRNTTVANNSIGYTLDTARVGYYRPNSLAGVESMVNYCLGKQLVLVGGLQAEYEKLAESFSKSYSPAGKVDPPPPTKPGMLDNQLISLFLQGEFTFLENFSIIGGARFDHSTVYDNVLSPRLGLIYNTDKLNLKLNYTEAFRAPRPWDYTSGTGNPTLQPEEISSLEFSAIYSPGKHLGFDALVYHNLLDGVMDKKDSGDSYMWINSGRLYTTGFETTMRIHTGNFGSYINYSYCNSLDEKSQMIPEIARHSANMGASYSILSQLRFELGANYFGKKKNPVVITATGNDQIDPAMILRFTASWFPEKGPDIQVVINNLLNTKYYHSSNRPPERYRQPQRSIRIKCRYHFQAK